MSEDHEIRIDKVREFVDQNGEDVWPGGRDNTANVLGEDRELSEPMSDAEARKAMFARSRRGFLVGGAAVLGGILGWRWMSDETRAGLFRRTFEFNERVSQAFYSPKRLAPEFPPHRITAARVNGFEGLENDLDLAAWRLRVGGIGTSTEDLILTLDEIKALPRTEIITELKCIEGWSIVVHWAGVRFSDFTARYFSPDFDSLPPYVSLTTPDEKYFVGWDLRSMVHPQTLLAYEMNGEPLTSAHGAPLRLTSPTKYGIKLIKRIGRIEFTYERPRDFWAQPEYGYDWYSGH